MEEKKDFEIEISKLKNKLNQIFDNYSNKMEQPEPLDEIQWVPDMDVLENKDEILIKVDIPGMKPDDIELSISENRLQIKGEREIKPEREDENYHFMERGHGKFLRRVNLPVLVNNDNIKASYKDGVLTIRLSKLNKEKIGKVNIAV